MLKQLIKEWIAANKNPLIPPLQIVENGIKIAGNMFPKHVSGFVRFKYNDTFGIIPWNSAKSYWKKGKIFWNRGEIEGFHGKKEVIVENTGTRINSCWKRIGYFPSYWRRTRIFIPHDKPVGLDPLDVWPSQQPEIEKYTYTIVFSGEIAIHEICQPIANKSLFEHQILVNPLQISRIARYYKSEDFLVEYKLMNGEWKMVW